MDEAAVNAVLDDWRTAPITSRLRAALGYLEKLVHSPAALTSADIEPLRTAGLSNTAIREAAYAAFLFSVMDRLADAFDFYIPPAAQVRTIGQMLDRHGYARLKQIR